MVVRGVRSSCETAERKSSFFRDRMICARRAFPKPIDRRKSGPENHAENDRVNASQPAHVPRNPAGVQLQQIQGQLAKAEVEERRVGRPPGVGRIERVAHPAAEQAAGGIGDHAHQVGLVEAETLHQMGLLELDMAEKIDLTLER